MSEKHIYDEYKVPSQFWGWVILVLFATAIVSYGMWLMMVVPDAPRYWDHGQETRYPGGIGLFHVPAAAGLDGERDRGPPSRGKTA